VPECPIKVISDKINNAYKAPREAWQARNLQGYQKIARQECERGANFLDVNIDATQTVLVRMKEMLDFLPELIPALQEASSVPLCFDNPSIEFQRTAMKAYDRSKGGMPILNSVAASRENLQEMIELSSEFDTKVIVMASEKFVGKESAQCFSAQEVYGSAKRFVEMLREKAGRKNEDIIIDPGLAPVSADTYGIVNMGLDAMDLIRADQDLQGVHISVGLSNFGWGTPREVRRGLEKAYIRLGMDRGLDFLLANPSHELTPLDPEDETITILKKALAAGRPQEGASQEDAGFCQAEVIMELLE